MPNRASEELKFQYNFLTVIHLLKALLNVLKCIYKNKKIYKNKEITRFHSYFFLQTETTPKEHFSREKIGLQKRKILI